MSVDKRDEYINRQVATTKRQCKKERRGRGDGNETKMENNTDKVIE